MSSRLQARFLVSALIRAAEAQGGSGMVLSRGDPDSGTILIVHARRGEPAGMLERQPGADGSYRWSRVGPETIDSTGAAAEYLQRRRRIDPDLWVVELDIADAERLAAEIIGAG